MKTPRLLIHSLTAFFFSSPLFAGPYLWDGGSLADSFIATPENWDPDGVPPSDLATNLAFDGTARLTPNFSVPFSANSLTFNDNAAVKTFTFIGAELTLGTTGILNNDPNPQTFGNPITLGTASTTFNAASGSLIFNNTVALGGGTLNVTGSQATTLAGAITGAGLINKTGTGTLTLSNTTIAADVTVADGSVAINSAGTTVFDNNSVVAVNAGSFLADGNVTLGGTRLTRSLFGTVSLAAGKTLTIQNGGDAIFTGGYTQNTAATINVTGAGSTFTLSGNSEFRGGSMLNITAGGSVSNSAGYTHLANSGGNATVLVDGAGSSFSQRGGLWGGNGNTAVVTFANGATGSVGIFAVANSGAGSVGTVSVLSGSSLTADVLYLAGTTDAATATLTVDGTGSRVTLNPGGVLALGAASGSVATLNVQNGGTFTTSTAGGATVNATGTVAITGGTFNANGGMILEGQLTRDATGVFNLADGKTLTVQHGGAAHFLGGFGLTSDTTLNVTGPGSAFTLSGDSEFRGNSALNITEGGSFSNSAWTWTNLAASDWGNATVLVDGAGSSFSTAGVSIGTNGYTGTLTFANGATGSLGETRMAKGYGSTGRLEVLSGSHLTMGTLTLTEGYLGDTGGEFTVDGAGSVVTQTGGAELILGDYGGSPADLTVSDGGTFTSGTGPVYLNESGTLTIDGGTVNLAGSLQDYGGVLDFITGALSIVDNFTVGTDGLLGTSVTFDSTRDFTTSATTTIDKFRTLKLDGGTFSTGTMVNHGTLAFTSGTLVITGAGGFNIGTGALGSNVILGTGANLQVYKTTTLDSGALLRLDGGSFTSHAVVNNGTIDDQNGAFTVNTLTNAAGGRLFVGGLMSADDSTIVNAGRITLQNGLGLIGGEGTILNTGTVTGDGTIDKAFTNSASGRLRAEAGKTLVLTGTIAPNTGTFSLEGGALEFTNPVTNSATGTITGYGTFRSALLTNNGNLGLSGNTRIDGDVTNAAGARIITSGGSTTTFYDDVIHNGSEIRTSAGGATVFFGAVSGAGPFTGAGTVYFEGDLRPGSSPAVVTMAPEIVLSPSNGLTMEIGGRTAGTGYDQLVFTNPGASQLTWGGTLVVELINGFTPVAGDAFHVFDFDPARAAGTFATVTVVSHGLLPAGLAFDFTALYTTGVIRVVSTAGTTFGQWAATALGNPAALPGGDHDNDGYRNLTEYALALFPVYPGVAAPIGDLHLYPDGERLRLRFWRQLDRTDITIRVQASANLVAWDDVAVSVNSAPFTGAGFVAENRAHPAAEPGLVEVRDILNTTDAACRWLRIQVTLSP